MAGKRLVDQKRLRAKKRRRLFFIYLYLFFSAGLVICGASLLSSLGAFQIRDVSVIGTDRQSSSSVESVAREALSGAYLWLFPRSDTFIYSKGAIEDALLALPLVKSADISRRGLSGIEIRITEREEAARWCDAQGACYSVDDEGFIFARTASSSAFAYGGLIEGEPIGQALLTGEKFKNIEFFIREIRNLALSPIGGMFSANEYLVVTLAGGGRLFIYMEDDLSAVLATLDSIISDKRVAPSLDAFLAGLDYLRLDAGNKVTYKKK